MKGYRCPVCKKPLTKKEFEDALGLLSERDEYYAEQIDAMQGRLRSAQEDARRARQAGIQAERSRSQRLMAGQKAKIKKLQERVAQLEKGSTPQTDGLEDEKKLVARLRRTFRDDDIQHKGKGGDVLHIVRFGRKPAGIIIYECKRCPGIKSEHVRQTYLAKQSREADFAVLVTTGMKKGFSGLAEMGGVLVVAPLGVVALASLLRLHLIEMERAKVAKQQRALLAQQVMAYVTSPQFKNPIEEIIQTAAQLQEMVKDEYHSHVRTWRKRLQRYQTIRWDGSHIQANLRLVLHGKKPNAAIRKEIVPLALPVPAERYAVELQCSHSHE